MDSTLSAIITRALDRNHTPAEIALLVDLPIEDIQAFSANLWQARDAMALDILRAGGTSQEAMDKSALSAGAIRALQNRLAAEKQEAEAERQSAAAAAEVAAREEDATEKQRLIARMPIDPVP